MDAQQAKIGGAILIPHQEVSELLFGVPVDTVCRRALEHLNFFVAPEATPSVLHSERRCMSFYSASDRANHRRIDEARVAKGSRPIGFDCAVASRSFATLKHDTRDLFVSRGQNISDSLETYAERTQLLGADGSACRGAKIGLVDLGYEDVYNLADAFLMNAVRTPAVLTPLILALVEEPELLIRVYDSNPAVLLCLEYLFCEAKKRGRTTAVLNVELNSPQVFEEMNHKSFLHPSLEQALALDTTEIAAFEGALLGEYMGADELRHFALDSRQRIQGLLDLRCIDLASLEASYPAVLACLTASRKTLLAQLSAASRMGRMGIYRLVDMFKNARSLDLITENPGLNVEYSDEVSFAEFVKRCHLAADLLRSWFAFEHLCFKWSHSTDGENILSGVVAGDLKAIDEFAVRAYGNRQTVVVEAHTYIEKVELAGQEREVCPSALIIAGRALRGRLAPQCIDGKEWIGNDIVTPRSSRELGLDDDVFELADAYTEFVAAAARNHKYSIAIGGLDYCVCTLGGVFGELRAVLLQDPNLRFTGSVPAYAVYESMAAKLGTPDIVVSTRKYVPLPGTALKDVMRCLDEISGSEPDLEIFNLSFTSTWSMFAVAGKRSLTEIIEVVQTVQHQLALRALAESTTQTRASELPTGS
jgi:hypothetical protein